MKVLFLSVPTGQGHHQAAKAVLEFFKDYQDVECRFLDIIDYTSSLLAESIQRGYLLSTKVTPKMYGTIYDMADRRDYSKHSAMATLLESVFTPKLLKYLKQYNPDVIVSTHVFSAIALTYIKRKYPIKAKTVAIVTDFAFHPFWEDADMDYYVTASELLDYQGMKKGLPRHKIKSFGIPILPKFATSMPKEEARKILGLDDRFTILFMMGSMGYGSNSFKTVKSLNRMKERFQLITVCGKNERLKQKIDQMVKYKKIINYGFTNEISLLMDAADCIITKPGGLSSSEALAKSLPMILLDPIPGQEDRNKEFMLNNGIALSVSDTFPITEAVYQLLHYDYKLKALKENIKHIAKPNSTRDLGLFLLEISKSGTKINM